MTAELTHDQIEAGRRLFAGPKHFMLGVVALDGLPKPGKPEIAFAGRSNVGKSSLINALTGVHDLARASNTPGRTQELNFFNVDDRLVIVDMPGYGFAEAPKKDVKRWQALLRDYLKGRAGLLRCFVLIDARHGLKEIDKPMLALLDSAAVTYQLVLTKADKLKEAELERVVAETQKLIKKHPAAFPQIRATSSETGVGIAELRADIAALAGVAD